MRLLSTPNPSNHSQSVGLTAEVDGLGGAAPAGSVQFFDGATSLGSAALGSATGAGQATISAGATHSCALTGARGVSWGVF